MRHEVKIRLLENGKGLDVPFYATEHSAGMDLQAAIDKDVVIEAGQRQLIPTGVAIALPEGLEAQIRPRSGLALKHGVTILNAPGTIDADYRGEIAAILINLGQEAFTITRGMRIAQMVIAEYVPVALVPADSLNKTTRGDGGFGSTGTHQPQEKEAVERVAEPA